MPANALPSALLALAAGDSDISPSAANRALDAMRDEAQLEYITRAGLGALLHSVLRNRADALSSEGRQRLLAADLGARVRHQQLVDTAIDVIDLCSAQDVTPTLLKGICVATQWYPSGHLRPMGDIDILVPPERLGALKSTMLRNGYVPDASFREEPISNHTTPLSHPKHGVWVELHTKLFPSDGLLACCELFDSTNIVARCVPETFFGRRVLFLRAELQLAYIASYWARDLTVVGMNPSQLAPLFDAAYLLKHRGGQLDWNALLASIERCPFAGASLLLLLSCLPRGCESVTHRVRAALASQRIAGPREVAVMSTFVRAYLLSSRSFSLFNSWHIFRNLLTAGSARRKLFMLPWRILFPPRFTDRYTLRYHLDRIRRRLNRASAQ